MKINMNTPNGTRVQVTDYPSFERGEQPYGTIVDASDPYLVVVLDDISDISMSLMDPEHQNRWFFLPSELSLYI